MGSPMAPGLSRLHAKLVAVRDGFLAQDPRAPYKHMVRAIKMRRNMAQGRPHKHNFRSQRIRVCPRHAPKGLREPPGMPHRAYGNPPACPKGPTGPPKKNPRLGFAPV